MTRLTYQEKAKMISEGKINDIQPALTKEEKINLQYELPNYSKETLDFLFSLEKDIDLKYHMKDMSKDLLEKFMKLAKKNKHDLSFMMEDLDHLKQLFFMESAKKTLLTPTQRSEVFNEKLNNREADDVLRILTVNTMSENEEVELSDRKCQNGNDFNIFKKEFMKNMEEFAKKYDLPLMKSHNNYENYLIDSGYFMWLLKRLVTMKNMDFQSLYETLHPILSIPEEQGFTKIMTNMFFDLGYHHEQVNDRKLLEKFSQFINDKDWIIKFNQRHNAGNMFHLTIKEMIECTQFIKLLSKSLKNKFNEKINQDLAYQLRDDHRYPYHKEKEHYNLARVDNMEKFKNFIKNFRILMESIHKVSPDFKLSKEIFSELKKNIEKKTYDLLKQEKVIMFKEKLNELPLEIKKNIEEKYQKHCQYVEKNHKFDQHHYNERFYNVFYNDYKNIMLSSRVKEFLSGFLDETGEFKEQNKLSIVDTINYKIGHILDKDYRKELKKKRANYKELEKNIATFKKQKENNIHAAYPKIKKIQFNTKKERVFFDLYMPIPWFNKEDEDIGVLSRFIDNTKREFVRENKLDYEKYCQTDYTKYISFSYKSMPKLEKVILDELKKSLDYGIYADRYTPELSENTILAYVKEIEDNTEEAKKNEKEMDELWKEIKKIAQH